MKAKTNIYLIVAIILNIFIWTQSLLSADISGAQSGFVTNTVMNVLAIFKINLERSYVSYTIRKLAHFTEFFLLGLFWFLFFVESKKVNKPFIVTFYLGLLTALTDEFIQYFTPGRAMLASDVMIDLGGVVFALVIGSIYFKNKKKNKH